MSVPSKRRPRSEAGGRAGHHALKKKILSPCSHCKKEIPYHQICPFCGYYKGREVIHIKLKKEKTKKSDKGRKDSGESKAKGKEERKAKKQDKEK